jgi:hypothetical protein
VCDLVVLPVSHMNSQPVSQPASQCNRNFSDSPSVVQTFSRDLFFRPLRQSVGWRIDSWGHLVLRSFCWRLISAAAMQAVLVSTYAQAVKFSLREAHYSRRRETVTQSIAAITHRSVGHWAGGNHYVRHLSCKCSRYDVRPFLITKLCDEIQL